jgi:glycosyltransferase involved in cell wall biosynthesis
MRILYICGDLGIPVLGHRGGSIHVRSLVSALAHAGHAVTLASPLLTKSAGQRPAAFDVPVLHVEPSERTVGASRSLAGFERTVAGGQALSGEIRRILYNDDLASALMAAYRDAPPDVIYERYALNGTAGATVAGALGVPLLLEVNAPLVLEDREYRGGGALGALADAAERWTISRADAVIAVSAALREHVLALGVPGERIHVVPNGVDPGLFQPAPRAAEVRRRWGLNGGPILGFVGGYQPWHGVQLLPSLLERLLPRHPGLRLVIVGDGRGRDAFEREIAASGLGEHILITGALPHEDVPALIREFDVAIAPYPTPRHDFYFSPLKLFEYMGCGVSVVAPRLGQIEEVVRDGETGLLYSPSRLDECEAACDRLLSDRALADRLGRAAAEETHRNHTWDQSAARVTRIAEGLIAEPAARR